MLQCYSYSKAKKSSIYIYFFIHQKRYISRPTERPLLLSRQGPVRLTPVQYEVRTARYNYTRRNGTKIGTVHDFSLYHYRPVFGLTLVETDVIQLSIQLFTKTIHLTFHLSTIYLSIYLSIYQ